MKIAVKTVLALLLCGVAVLASQERPRAYVAECICSVCSYLFGN